MFTSGFGLPIYVYPIFYVKERKQNAVAESLVDRMKAVTMSPMEDGTKGSIAKVAQSSDLRRLGS